MSNLPLAEIERAYAVKVNGGTVIIVDGYTSGYGGSIDVWRSPALIDPPLFYALAVPGNCGFNPNHCPTRVPTTDAKEFPGNYPTIQLQHASGRTLVKATKSFPEQPTSQPSNHSVSTAPSSASTSSTLELGWTAVHDFMPPGPAKLRVKGVIMMPTPGYRLNLTRATPQGINPAILLLNLDITPPTGIQPQVLTPTPVAYEEQSNERYRSVQIEPIHELVDVQEVH
ncbi:MAG TPA: hypothetical protein VEC99_04380 [Clostridia bacterium]|nr:hypothetical protein [Clostridia bacterium]